MSGVGFVRCALLSLLTIVLAAPRDSEAQTRRAGHDFTAGGAIGLDGSTASGYPGGPELAGFIEAPLADDLKVRGEVGVGYWDVEPPFGGDPDDSLRRHRITGSVIKPLTSISPSRRTSVYVGGGAGLYFYRFRRHDNSATVGVHGLGGVDYLLKHPSRRWLVGGEAQVQILGAPDDPGGDGTAGVIHVRGFVKYRF
jgi:hypothetical protein